MASSKRRVFWGNSPKYKKRQSNEAFVQNRFQYFSDMDDSSADDETVSEIPEIEVSPIIVDAIHGFTTVFKLIGSQYKYKRMSIGTKIFSNTILLYEEAIKKLQQHKFQFYTHQTKNSKNFKMVLFGLPQIDCKTIEEEFKNTHNIQPTSVKEIKTKRSNIDDALFMIEFDKSQVTKKEIIKIRYFYGISVHWRNPLKGNRGPTQCSKCSMYGHGARNCHRSNVCPACAGDHDYSVCVLAKTPHKGPVIYKCFNCAKRKLKDVNHRADDENCPCRLDYIEIRQRVTSRYSRTENRRNHQNENQEFMHSQTNINNSNQTQKTYDISPHGRLYSDILKNNINTERHSVRERETDDISNDRLLQIFFEAVDALEKCKNKFDKLRVLGKMLSHVI